MRILIHACPRRLWYAEEFLAPELRRQGAETVDIWNDKDGAGNLISCMNSFATRSGDGGTWHLQDDVLPCRDFVERAREMDTGVVYGFCCEAFTDDPFQSGRVSIEDAWHSFQCIRIPDEYARDCAAWLETDGRQHEHYPLWISSGRMDDAVFRAYMLEEHPRDMVVNAKPCLVEHVDWIVGGSVLSPWRGYLARATWWTDEELVRELKETVKGHARY